LTRTPVFDSLGEYNVRVMCACEYIYACHAKQPYMLKPHLALNRTAFVLDSLERSTPLV